MKYETGYKMPKLCQHQNYSPSIFSQTLRNKERRYIFVVRRETPRGNRYGSLFGVFFLISVFFKSSVGLSLKLLLSEWAWLLSGLGDSRLLGQVPSTERNAGAGGNCACHDRERDHASGLSLKDETSARAKIEWVDGRGRDDSGQLSNLGDDRGKYACWKQRGRNGSGVKRNDRSSWDIANWDSGCARRQVRCGGDDAGHEVWVKSGCRNNRRQKRSRVGVNDAANDIFRDKRRRDCSWRSGDDQRWCSSDLRDHGREDASWNGRSGQDGRVE